MEYIIHALKTGKHGIGSAVGKTHGGHALIRIDLTDRFIIYLIYDGGDAIVILDGIDIVVHMALITVKILFQRLKIIFLYGGEHAGHGLHFRDLCLLCLRIFRILHKTHEIGHAETGAVDLQRIHGEGLLFYIFNIVIDTVGQGEDQRNANDADGAGDGNKKRPGLFGAKVIETQSQCGAP